MTDEQMIRKTVERLSAFLQSHDAALPEPLFMPACSCILPSGRQADGPAGMHALHSHLRRYGSPAGPDIHDVRLLSGDTALVSFTGSTGKAARHYVCSVALVRRDGDWLIALLHCSLVRRPGLFRRLFASAPPPQDIVSPVAVPRTDKEAAANPLQLYFSSAFYEYC